MPTGPRYFYPRSPCGERPLLVHHKQLRVTHFYPRSPCGERLTTETHTTAAAKFLSTLSLRRATQKRGGGQNNPHPISIHALLAESDVHIVKIGIGCLVFLSTLSLRRATGDRFPVVDVLPISIHALLAESDVGIFGNKPYHKNFYPRSPCGERR